MKRILATGISKHNNIRTENKRVASWPEVSDLHATCQETTFNQVTNTSCYILTNALFIA